MSALAAALCALVTSADPAPPGVVVLVSRRTAVPQAVGRELAAQVATLLGKAGIPLASDAEAVTRRLARLGVKDTAHCNGRKVCVAEVARQLEAPWVVALSVSRIESDRSLALELIRAEDVAVVAKDSVVLAKTDKLTAELLAGFVDKARTALGLVPPAPEPVVTPTVTPDKPPPDAPVQTALTPTPPPVVPPPVVPPPAPEKSHTASWVLGGAGVAALGAATAMLVLGLSSRAALARGQSAGDRTLSELTEPQAVQLNTRSNVELGVAAGAGALGLGLGTAAVLVW